jgi:hypothetical protein
MTVPSVSTRQVLGLVPEGGLVTFVHCAWAQSEQHSATTSTIPIRENKLMFCARMNLLLILKGTSIFPGAWEPGTALGPLLWEPGLLN